MKTSKRSIDLVANRGTDLQKCSSISYPANSMLRSRQESMNRAGDFLCPLFTVRDRLLETEVTFGLHDDHYENWTWKNASVSLLNAPSKNSQHNQQSRNMKSTYRKVSATRLKNSTASSIDGLAVSSLCNTRTLESCSQKILLVRACVFALYNFSTTGQKWSSR